MKDTFPDMRFLASQTVLSLAAALTLSALAPAAHAQVLDDFSQGFFDSGDVVITDPGDTSQMIFRNTSTISSGFRNGTGTSLLVDRAFTFTVTAPKVDDRYTVFVNDAQQALNVSTGPSTAGVTQVLYTGANNSNLELDLNSSPVFRVAFLASDQAIDTEVRLFTTSGEFTVNRAIAPIPFSRTATNYDYDFSSFAGTRALSTVNRVQFTYTGPQAADFIVDSFSLVPPTASAVAPEPGSIALLLTAGVPVAAVIRRRAKKRADR